MKKTNFNFLIGKLKKNFCTDFKKKSCPLSENLEELFETEETNIIINVGIFYIFIYIFFFNFKRNLEICYLMAIFQLKNK